MHITLWQAIFLGFVQGITELFPISSLGHMVIIPGLLNWADIERNDSFLPFLTALHLGTATALVIYFWRDWLQVIRSLFLSVKDGNIKKGGEEWVSWLIIIGCIPGGLIGVFLETPLKKLFGSPIIAASFLIVNGFILFAGEWLRRRAEKKHRDLAPKEREAHFRPLATLSWKEAVVVGLGQSLALIPGISRSGTTMVAALGIRLSYEDAARYSFLLGTPLIAAAALLEVPQLFTQAGSTLALIGVGIVVAGVAAFFSTKFLMKYFETGRLTPFAYYCCGAGLLALIFFLTIGHTNA